MGSSEQEDGFMTRWSKRAGLWMRVGGFFPTAQIVGSLLFLLLSGILVSAAADLWTKGVPTQALILAVSDSDDRVSWIYFRVTSPNQTAQMREPVSKEYRSGKSVGETVPARSHRRWIAITELQPGGAATTWKTYFLLSLFGVGCGVIMLFVPLVRFRKLVRADRLGKVDTRQVFDIRRAFLPDMNWRQHRIRWRTSTDGNAKSFRWKRDRLPNAGDIIEVVVGPDGREYWRRDLTGLPSARSAKTDAPGSENIQ